MKKVIISVLMVCLIVTTAFASRSTEDTRAWFDANNIALCAVLENARVFKHSLQHKELETLAS